MAASYPCGVNPRLTVQLPQPASGSGRYRYLLNGEPTEVEETFSVPADRKQPTTSRRTAPGGVVLSASATWSEAMSASISLSFISDSSPPVQVEYELTDGHLRARGTESRPLDLGSLRATPTVGSSFDAILSPLLRVFQGPTIAEVLHSGGASLVIVPALDPTNSETLLEPRLQYRTANVTGSEPITEQSSSSRKVGADASTFADGQLRKCSYVGGNYDDSAEFWLDIRDRLVRYVFPQAGDIWEVRLDE